MTATDADAPGTIQRERLRRCFPDRSRVFLPVLQVHEEAQAALDVRAARDAGADGVFLVNHGMGHQRLLRIARQAAEAHTGFFVGVNCLDLPVEVVFSRLPPVVRGVWSGVDPALINRPETAIRIREARRRSGWEGLHFGGLRSPSGHSGAGLPSETLCAAASYADVVICGSIELRALPTLAEMRALRDSLHHRPLAWLMNAAFEDLSQALECCDCVLTPAGAGQHPHSSDPAHLGEIAEGIREFERRHAARSVPRT